jgi:hypothetical protein
VVHPRIPPANPLLVAMGKNHQTDFLRGFEASAFTVDCAMTGTPSGNLAVGAVALTGQHVLWRRIRVIAFGVSGSGDFLPVFNSVTGPEDWELTTEAEDAFLVR